MGEKRDKDLETTSKYTARSQRCQGLPNAGGVRFNRACILTTVCFAKQISGDGKHMETRLSWDFWCLWTLHVGHFRPWGWWHFQPWGLDAAVHTLLRCTFTLYIILNSYLFFLFTLSLDKCSHVRFVWWEVRSRPCSQLQELWRFSGASALVLSFSLAVFGQIKLHLEFLYILILLHWIWAIWCAWPLNSAPVSQCFNLAVIVFNTNLIPWPRKWQFFEGNPPFLIQLMFKLISTLGLSPSAFEVNNRLVLPFKWSRFEHTLCRERLCQAFQRAVCIF